MVETDSKAEIKPVETEKIRPEFLQSLDNAIVDILKTNVKRNVENIDYGIPETDVTGAPENLKDEKYSVILVGTPNSNKPGQIISSRLSKMDQKVFGYSTLDKLLTTQFDNIVKEKKNLDKKQPEKIYEINTSIDPNQIEAIIANQKQNYHEFYETETSFTNKKGVEQTFRVQVRKRTDQYFEIAIKKPIRVYEIEINSSSYLKSKNFNAELAKFMTSGARILDLQFTGDFKAELRGGNKRNKHLTLKQLEEEVKTLKDKWSVPKAKYDLAKMDLDGAKPGKEYKQANKAFKKIRKSFAPIDRKYQNLIERYENMLEVHGHIEKLAVLQYGFYSNHQNNSSIPAKRIALTTFPKELKEDTIEKGFPELFFKKPIDYFLKEVCEVKLPELKTAVEQDNLEFNNKYKFLRKK